MTKNGELMDLGNERSILFVFQPALSLSFMDEFRTTVERKPLDGEPQNHKGFSL